VVAIDSHGQPVNDLTIDDFQVSDAGKAQKIAFFRHNNSKLQQTSALGPHEYSNRAGANVPHATLILFDLLNEHLAARGNAWYELIRVLQPLESGDFLYLYLLTLDGHLYPVRGLPGTGQESLDPSGAAWTRQAKPLLDESMRAVSRVRPSEIDIDTRVRLTFAALESMAAGLAAVPGRKNIVWITHGVPISIDEQRVEGGSASSGGRGGGAMGGTLAVGGDYIDYTPELQRLSAVLDRCNVAIYPVQQVPPGMATPGSQEAQYSGLGSLQTLQQFAGLTGGRSNASNDIGAAIRQAMNDVRTSYQIGYYPPPENWDRKYHKLRVTCARKGVRVQTKVGYYAWPDDAGSDERDVIRSVVSASFDAAEIGLRGTFSPSATEVRAGRFIIRMDPADIQLVSEGGQYTGHLRLAIVGYGADGKTDGSGMWPIDLRLSSEQREKDMKEGISIGKDVQFGETVEKVRFIVFDRGSNAIGSLTIPVKADARNP
jgi:VWFA-related protein